MSFINGLAPHWLWLIAAVALAILEVLLPGIFLVWIAAAAGLTGLALLFFDFDFPIQAVLFAVLAFAAVAVGRRYYARNPMQTSDPKLNERAARLIGKTVTVETAIRDGSGRVRVGDGVWNARGADAPAGTAVVIVAADGTCLTVEPAP